MNRWLLTILAAALCLPGFAQLNRGTISGAVTDASGAAVPGAQVNVRLTTTNSVTRSVTNDAGQYNLPNLQTGSYDITIEAKGFKRFVMSNLELRVTDVLRVDAALDIGSMVETVEVAASVDRVQTDSPQVGTSLTNSGLIDLPMSFSGARNPENFAYKLTPGVTGSSWTSHINGSSTASKEVLLEAPARSRTAAGTMVNRPFRWRPFRSSRFRPRECPPSSDASRRASSIS